MSEQENATRFVVSVRGYGHPDKVHGDHERTLRRLLEHHFGDRYELTLEEEPG